METPRILAILGWAALTLTSCFPVAKQPDAEILAQQVARWEKAICRKPVIFSMSVLPAEKVRQLCDDKLAVGCYMSGFARMVLSEGQTPEYAARVLVHEVGHALDDFTGGEKHVARGQGVLEPSVRRMNAKITEADITLVCNRIKCSCRNPE